MVSEARTAIKRFVFYDLILFTLALFIRILLVSIKPFRCVLRPALGWHPVEFSGLSHSLY